MTDDLPEALSVDADRFEENGAQNGAWSQRGSLVTFDMNRGYAEYVGVIIGEARIVGKAKNVAGSRWDWMLAEVKDGDDVAGLYMAPLQVHSDSASNAMSR